MEIKTVAQSVNPLAKHFRQPAIYLKLPSQGRFYPPDGIELSMTGDIPIFPMTVKDELTLKTPDALMNGQGMADVIGSCCPSIRDPWTIPAVDLDAIFIAIRLASYGQGMDITSSCPHCNESNEYVINLNTLLENLTPANYTEGLNIDGLVIKFKPQSYKDINKLNLASFEQRKLIANVTDADIPDDEKRRLFDESFKKITDLNIGVIVDSIESIFVDQSLVTDVEMIKEFLDNCGRQTYQAIKDRIQALAEKNSPPPAEVTCANEDCGKEYQTPLVFDQSNFFV
jgi:hypothetical protein